MRVCGVELKGSEALKATDIFPDPYESHSLKPASPANATQFFNALKSL